MGNKLGLTKLNTCNKMDLRSRLSAKQVVLLKKTWDIIKLDVPKIGVMVFKRFFETEPDMKSVFPKIVLMNNDNKLECDIDREMLQKHAITVMEGLGASVESLDDSQFLNSVLISIGQTHIQRHVKPQMLKRLWPSLNYGLSKVLQTAYTRQVADAWKKVFDYICVYMKHGMENPDMDPDNPVDLER